jgi:hypothetical protein
MGDSTKLKITLRSSSHGSNNGRIASSSNCTLLPRMDLEAQVIASSSLVSSAKDVHSWLEKKGLEAHQ